MNGEELFLDNDRKELIKLFMSEAKEKHGGLKDGLGKHPHPQTYKEAIGLVDVCVAFESLINVLDTQERRIWKKRKLFSLRYQAFFISIKDSLIKEVDALELELRNDSLINMTPNSNDTLKIDNKKDLHQIIEVIYRVRSNMVHGNKSLSSSRNKILIGNSFNLLYKIMDAVLRKEKIIS